MNSASPVSYDGSKAGGPSGASGGALVSPSGKSWPQQANVNSHHAKTARMEAAAMSGFGGGIPAKIEEVSEPAD